MEPPNDLLVLMATIELPVFDISKPFDSSSLQALSQACKEWGFFRITNHGVSRDLYAKLCVLSDRLFGLSDETKLKVGPLSSEKTYTPHFVASPFFESLRVSGPDFYASALSSAKILLQDHNNADQFSEILKEYGNMMTELSKRIVEVLLMSLGTDFEKKFKDSEFGKCNGYFRIINYTAPKRVTPTEIKEHKDEKEEEDVEGLGMHTDMSCVTIVNQNQIGGLQVRSKQGNKWMDIKPCDQTLVVNVGDLLQAWSNGMLSSSEHRVVLRQPVGRFSTAFFWCFEDKKVVFAPEEVVGVGNYSRAYRPFVCEEYLKYRSAMASMEEGDEKKFENVGLTVKDFAGISI